MVYCSRAEGESYGQAVKVGFQLTQQPTVVGAPLQLLVVNFASQRLGREDKAMIIKRIEVHHRSSSKQMKQEKRPKRPMKEKEEGEVTMEGRKWTTTSNST